MRLDEVVKHFLKDAQVKNRTGNTLTIYRYSLNVLLRLLRDNCGITELECVTVLHLRECVQLLSTPAAFDDDREGRPAYRRGRRPVSGKLSVSSIRSHVRIWKAFFRWCFQEELMEKNVVARLSMPKPEKRVIQAFTEEHIRKILSSIDTSTELGFRDYVIVVLLLDTGMRLSEVCSLTVDSVHDDYVKVFGKGRKEREIGIHPEVSKLIWKYIHKYRHPLDLNEKALFLAGSSDRGKPLQVGGVKQAIERIKEVTGIEDVRFSAHTFRHTFAKMYLENGGELFKLSRELGHSDIDVTKVYLEDFGSTEARRDHTTFSPLSRVQLKKAKGRKRSREQNG
ncbi:MAG TPA: tyrosine-type recombinase/integrase [Ktedonobacteraceae bacterium]|jgi:integrase/recombinase XerD|nr:tyrosine-type recombinase/integrase [Ktedonobacteraceae bacterium]HLI06051.1 tyrosine-type recombinase/integrase [Ktedonobacteraceae bacterium]